MGKRKKGKWKKKGFAPNNGEEYKEEGEDRFSELPDSLICYILSLINYDKDDSYDKSLISKEVTRTCLLSKRWKFIWTNMSKLDFIETSTNMEKISSFVNRIGEIVNTCNNHMHNFSIGFFYDESFAPYLNSWLQIVVQRNVKDISLKFLDRKKVRDKSYVLPPVLYSHSSLTSLYIELCVMTPSVTINWKSLKSLSIHQVKLSDGLMEKILSGCHVLEALHLVSFRGLPHLRILSSTLTILETVVAPNELKTFTLDISAPFLHQLIVYGSARRMKFKFRDISSLVKASIDLSECSMYPGNQKYMMQLLENLQCVRELELGQWCFEALAIMEMGELGVKIPSSSSLRFLTLNVPNNINVRGITIIALLNMLNSSPYLETLIINASDDIKTTWDHLGGTNSMRAKFSSMCRHLKTVKLNSFSLRDSEIMAQIFLKRATVLEKIIISRSGPSRLSESRTNFFEKVSSFPRVSPKAVIVIC